MRPRLTCPQEPLKSRAIAGTKSELGVVEPWRILDSIRRQLCSLYRSSFVELPISLRGLRCLASSLMLSFCACKHSLRDHARSPKPPKFSGQLAPLPWLSRPTIRLLRKHHLWLGKLGVLRRRASRESVLIARIRIRVVVSTADEKKRPLGICRLNPGERGYLPSSY